MQKDELVVLLPHDPYKQIVVGNVVAVVAVAAVVVVVVEGEEVVEVEGVVVGQEAYLVAILYFDF